LSHSGEAEVSTGRRSHQSWAAIIQDLVTAYTSFSVVHIRRSGSQHKTRASMCKSSIVQTVPGCTDDLSVLSINRTVAKRISQITAFPHATHLSPSSSASGPDTTSCFRVGDSTGLISCSRRGTEPKQLPHQSLLLSPDSLSHSCGLTSCSSLNLLIESLQRFGDTSSSHPPIHRTCNIWQLA
jgi:hypothetical protein